MYKALFCVGHKLVESFKYPASAQVKAAPLRIEAVTGTGEKNLMSDYIGIRIHELVFDTFLEALVGRN